MKQDIRFDSQGSSCAAWFFQPDTEGPYPIVVMAHGLAAIKEMRLAAYAEKFAEAGYASLVFDYRHFGESDGEPRQLLDVKKQHQDWKAAIEFARQLPGVDPKRVVLWGTSLSGGHVLQVASEVPGIAAVMAQVPHLSGVASLGMISLPKILSLTLHGSYDTLRGMLGLSPHYILSSGEPGELAIMTSPGESQGYLELVPEDRRLDRRIAARFATSVGLYSPIKALSKLSMPVLMQVATEDVTTPAKPGIKAAPKYANIELREYQTGHFQPYVEPMFSRIVGDQLAFLSTAVPL
ncbi:alpha/beta hydrolase [Spongiibacter tropicus]|uniref:alpha/beta hydrolase n=1 Tax=Spongiibacter tropicus TaxID=454602 RepID=UPI0035BE98D5